MNETSPAAWWYQPPRRAPERIQCDECKETFCERRIRRVHGFDEGSAGCHSIGNKHTHHFCKDCHRKVFDASDWRKYPALFSYRSPWVEGMEKWQTAKELGDKIGLDPRALATMIRVSGEANGWMIERYDPGSGGFRYRALR